MANDSEFIPKMEKPRMDMHSQSITSLAGWGTRHTFTTIVFLVTVCEFFLRFNLSTTIVVMVKKSTLVEQEAARNVNFTSEDCPALRNFPATTNETLSENGEFEWSPSEQGLLLSSLFYGYIVTQLPGGYLAERLGGKWIVCTGLFGSGLLNLLYPIAAKTDLILFVILRSFQGGFDGLVSSGVYALFSKWFPKHERSFLVSVAFSGANMGIIIVMPACAMTSDTFGWEAVFYVTSFIAACVGLLWIGLIHDSPDVHPYIEHTERDYIIQHTNCSSVDKLPMTPFAAILVSPCVLSMFLVHMAFCFGESLFSSSIPTYMADIQHYDIKTNGFLSSAPFVCNLLVSSPYGWALDRAIVSGRMTLDTARKASIAIALLGPAFCLVIMTLTGCQRVVTVLLLCLSQAASATILSGSFQNPVDLSPNYAGSLYGIMNPLGGLAAALAPLSMGWLTQDNETLSAWQNVFLLTTSIYILATAGTLIFGKFSVQDWNTHWDKDKAGLSKPTTDQEATESCI